MKYERHTFSRINWNGPENALFQAVYPRHVDNNQERHLAPSVRNANGNTTISTFLGTVIRE